MSGILSITNDKQLTVPDNASVSGTNTGDQTIALTGDVTGSGTGTFAATIAGNAITNAKLAQMPASTIKGNNAAVTANAADLTAADVSTMLGLGTLATQDANNVTITGGTITGVSGLGVPVGTIVPFAGSSAPSGWLLCSGQAISRTTYSALFGVVSTIYGTGDGSTTFNLPDLRGRVTAGNDNMGGTAAGRLTGTTMSPDGNTLGATGGEQMHTLSAPEMPSHNHGISDPGHTHTYFNRNAPDGGNIVGSGGGGNTSDTGSSTTGISIQNSGGGGAHNNTQPTLLMNMIIFAAA